MHLRMASAALVAALYVAAAWSQTAPAAEHGHHHGKAAAPAAKADVRPAPGAAAPNGAAYKSPFADYRPFKGDEPPKEWRRANDEVREAGGHMGLMKREAKK